jgi:hypothetical protein
LQFSLALLILGSGTDAIAWGSKGHRIIGLLAQELLLPETSAQIEAIMESADLATFGLYLDDNKDRLDQQIPGSRAWHYDNIPICGRKPHSEYCPSAWQFPNPGKAAAAEKFPVRIQPISCCGGPEPASVWVTPRVVLY